MVTNCMPWVVDLDDMEAYDPQVAATKAAMLARLQRAGLPALPGVVLAVAGSQTWLPAAGSSTRGGADRGQAVRAVLATAIIRLDGDPEVAGEGSCPHCQAVVRRDWP